jgi:hypothetical protein
MTGVIMTVTNRPEINPTIPSPSQEPRTEVKRDNGLDIESRLPSQPKNFRNGATVTQWEYATTPLLIHNPTQILNTWGDEGWELVTILAGPEGGLVAYFKRPLTA